MNTKEKTPKWKLMEEHDNEIQSIMEKTGSTFYKFKGKEFWNLAEECGHDSIDFNKCKCQIPL